MRIRRKLISILSLLIFLVIFFSINVTACKDIIACGDATKGDYNLLLKVRDPSRPGLQVLCFVPKDHEYTYQHPWTGKPMVFRTENKYIGIASEGDTIPDIVKAGMTLTEAGLGFGDADSNSGWVNPTKYAWDDFDWIRYSCEKAEDEQQAVKYLTEEAVKKLHATAVSENLFVIGPETGFIVEADAYRFDTREIKDSVEVMSNYPKQLWKTQWLKTRLISKDFGTTVEKTVKKNQKIRLGSLFGIKITDIGSDYISVSPLFLYRILSKKDMIVRINVEENATVGDFYVNLLEISDDKAKIQVKNVYKAWEDKMFEYITPKIGDITIADMISWSRLVKKDMDGLRPMCQPHYKYEAVSIYKIPKDNFETLSMGWFSANHACSSIYVPFHICNTEIYEPYKTGDAAQIGLDLLDIYDEKVLSENFSKAEQVFLKELGSLEDIVKDKDSEIISDFLTKIDTSMQKQAYYTQETWKEISTYSNKEDLIRIVSAIWDESYPISIGKMKEAVSLLFEKENSQEIVQKIVEIAKEICSTRIELVEIIGKDTTTINNKYEKGLDYFKQGDYSQGFMQLHESYLQSKKLLGEDGFNNAVDDFDFIDEDNDDLYINFLIITSVLILLVISIVLIRGKRK